MKRIRNIISQPKKIADLNFDAVEELVGGDWHEKAEALQLRRWRALKRAMRSSPYATY